MGDGECFVKKKGLHGIPEFATFGREKKKRMLPAGFFFWRFRRRVYRSCGQRLLHPTKATIEVGDEGLDHEYYSSTFVREPSHCMIVSYVDRVVERRRIAHCLIPRSRPRALNYFLVKDKGDVLPKI